MSNSIKQGDAYSLPVAVRLNGEALDIREVEAVEFCLGDVRRLYPGEVSYSEEDGKFYVPLAQEETLGFPENEAVAADVRVKFHGGNVLGARRLVYVTVRDAISEEVI